MVGEAVDGADVGSEVGSIVDVGPGEGTGDTVGIGLVLGCSEIVGS